MDYIVTKVRKQASGRGGNHEHIEGVCTETGEYYTRREVVKTLRTGSGWRTLAAGTSARIREVAFCLHPGCMATPYITTHGDGSAANNLENLPRC